MTAVPAYFTVVGDFRAVVADSAADSDYDPNLTPISATVTFTPMLEAGDMMLATAASPRPTAFVAAPVVARIDVADGRLKLRTTPDTEDDLFAPVRLLADTPLLNLAGPLFYSVRFSNVVFNGSPGTITGFTFQAPNADVELNLVTVARSPGQSAVGVTRLAPGGVRISGADMVFTFDGVDIPDPIPVETFRGPIGNTGATGASGATGYSIVDATPAGNGTAIQLWARAQTGGALVPVGDPITVSGVFNSTVYHGSNAGIARPNVDFPLVFVGSVEATSMRDGDIWLDTSGTAPVVSTATLNALNQGVPASQVLVAAGSTPVLWSVTAGALPAGVVLSSAGELSGTPTTSGAYSFTVTATNGWGTGTKTYTGTVASTVAPAITTTALSGTVKAGVAFSQTLTATGSVPITWSVSAGTLPAGLALDAATGLLSGTPTTAGSYSFTVKATNAAGNATQAFTGTVAGSAPVFTTTALNSLSQGAAFSQTLAVSGTAPITYAVQSGALPTGLSLATSTGVISGTPTAAGAYSVTVRATNSYGTADQTYTGTVASSAPTITTAAALGALWKSVAMTAVAIGVTGATPITFAVQSGTIPAGLALNTSTGVISGTPTTAGAYSFTIRATNSYGTADQAFTGSVVESAAAITETALNTMKIGVAFTQTLTVTGMPTVALSLQSGTLPTGLTFTASTGVISGTPTTAGAYSFTIRATNSLGYADRTYTGTVQAMNVAYSASAGLAAGWRTTGTVTLANVAGDDVFAVIGIKGGNPSVVTFTPSGGSAIAMTKMAQANNNGAVVVEGSPYVHGSISVYRLPGAQVTGPGIISVTATANSQMAIAGYAAARVGTATVVAANGGTDGYPGGTVTIPAQGMGVACYSAFGYTFTALGGGTTRQNLGTDTPPLAIVESATAGSNTFTGTLQAGGGSSLYWSLVTLVLAGG